MRILLLFSLFLMGSGFVLAQREVTESHLLVWGSSGFCTIKNGAAIAQDKGNVGFAIGASYEKQSRRLLLQAGLELSLYRSTMNLVDTLDDRAMIDDEGMPYAGHFTFKKTADLQRMTNIGVPLMIGYEFWNGMFFAIGGKAMLNLAVNTTTTTQVTKEAVYPTIIGGDGNGGLGNMPNHGLNTVTRDIQGSIRLNTLFTGSIEYGYTIPIKFENNIRSSKPKLRLSLFCDYGFAPVSKKLKTSGLIVNTSTKGDWEPAIKSYLLTEMQSNRLNVIYTGLKVTIVLGMKTYDCFCDSH